MPEEELAVVHLRDDFYRDGFNNVITLLVIMLGTLGLLIALAIFLEIKKPNPIVFVTDNEFRLIPPVPVDQPYLKPADLLQWVSTALPAAFTVDFVNYDKQVKQNLDSFTENGAGKYQDQLNIYANQTNVQNNKLFVSASASGAPFILNQGILGGKYAWWVQMPINLSYSNVEKGTTQVLTVQMLVTRIPTLNNLDGVAIENMIITKGGGEQ